MCMSLRCTRQCSRSAWLRVRIVTRFDCPVPSSPKTTMRGREAYSCAFFSKISCAAQASLIHTVGFLSLP
jgi:hypothetical protein